jgi:hypothetical protein
MISTLASVRTCRTSGPASAGEIKRRAARTEGIRVPWRNLLEDVRARSRVECMAKYNGMEPGNLYQVVGNPENSG